MINAWHDVPGFEGLYKVRRDGCVLSMGREFEAVRRGTLCTIRYKQKLLTPQHVGPGRQAARVALFKGEGVAHKDFYICDLVRAVFGDEAAAALPDAFRIKRKRRT